MSDNNENNTEIGKDNKETRKERDTKNERSNFSLEGAKPPLSIYTRRVMDISKIGNYLNQKSARGRIGGTNLGNTCFMNSSIACLSNCTELTYYFLKGDYKKDINTENKLGLHGDLAKEWGELLHKYWVEDTEEGNPSDLKSTISRKASIFRGTDQQDSNEFISIFLDCLNEDLNATTKKSYEEMNAKGKNESDEECSKRFWDCNLRRNNSIINDLFYGQFKCTLTCPRCGKINITFDPFDILNLPLTSQKKRNNYTYNYASKENMEEMKFFYVPKYNLRSTYCISIHNIEKSKTLDQVIERIRKEKKFIYHDKIDTAFLVDILRKEKWSYPEKTCFVNQFDYAEEYVYAFDLNENENIIKIPIYFLENEEKASDYVRMIFGKQDMTFDELKKKLYLNVRKYILSPLLKDNEEKDEISLEIEKYINDKKLELNEENLIKLIENEYNEIFNNIVKEKDPEVKAEKEKIIEKFINDIPFTIYMQKEKNYIEEYKMEFIDKNHFNDVPLKFNFILGVSNANDHLNITKSDDYEIKVKFNFNSKYINTKTFKLNYYMNYPLEYRIDEETIKEEEKDRNNKIEEENEDEDDSKMTLEKCLKKFCKEEQLEKGDEWYCSHCKDHVLAKKKIELYYLPKILIICFKRFIKDSCIWEKNDDEIEFPINGMNMQNFVIGPDKDHSIYDLFAVSQHYGSTGGGHYTAVCKNGGKWFSYDDSSCYETTERDAVSSAAYVLFYRRRTD